ncbi:MAG TPA: radical SAM protein [Anaerolineae bacterium]|nr:radical SAM protein [Anaerolineae bacterium]HQI82971.1 radical SAM protein [Anaerolineae bacterium]
MLLPDDCTFLPLAHGMLLVSREHAVFCRVPPGDVAAVRAVVRGEKTPDSLTPSLRSDLARHGFFDPPRPPKPDTPTVQLQLTNACNLACAYCCTNSGSRRAQEVSYAAMLDVVQQIPAVLGATTSVAILGGEPLLIPWALDLAEAITHLGLHLTLFTNGILLADADVARTAARLTQQGMQVRVSLGGVSPASCDAISGNRRFDAALRGLHNLAAFGGTATVDLMFMPQYAEAVARELPALREQLPAAMPVALGILYLSGREAGAHLFHSRAELEAALDRVAFEAGVAIPASQTGPVAYRREGCGCALGQHLHVRSDGALFNCFKMEEQVGDLQTTGFAAAATFTRAHPHRASDLPTCAACPLATLCGGGCRSENLLYTGDPDTPPCGPWRVRILSELLAEERVTAVEWPVAFLAQEARARGIATPDDLFPRRRSRHLLDV